MTSLRSISKCLAVCLGCILPFSLPVAVAVEASFNMDLIKDGLTPMRTAYSSSGMSVVTFRTRGMDCIGLVDAAGRLHYLFLQPRTALRNAEDIRRFGAEAKRLHTYLVSVAPNSAKVRLVTFSGGKSAAILFVTKERKSSFSRPVIKDNTLEVIDTAVDSGATFESLENGELTLVMPSKENSQERCALLVSLRKCKVEMLGFSPPPSQGKKEDTAVASLVSNLHLSRSSVDFRASSESLRELCRQTGADRCFTCGSDYIIVLYRKKLYVGPVAALRRYIRDHKKNASDSGFLGEFPFPSSEVEIPDGSSRPAKQEPQADGQPGKEKGDDAAEPPAQQEDGASPRGKALRDYLEYLRGLEHP